MKLNTVKKITVIGLLLSVLLCLIGMFGMEPSSPQASSMAVWAVVVLLFILVCYIIANKFGADIGKSWG